MLVFCLKVNKSIRKNKKQSHYFSIIFKHFFSSKLSTSKKMNNIPSLGMFLKGVE